MTRRWPASALALLLPAACGGQRPAEAGQAEAAPPPPADSLVLSVPGGAEVWFTVSREARSADGEACLERALEIRTDSTRRGVPLLYTREAPTRLRGDTMRAVLYNNCEPVAAYRVDFATASPRRISP